MRRATVFGCGSFGTAVATVLSPNFDEVVVWGREPEVVEGISSRHENARYLAGVTLPANLRGSADAAEAIAGAELAVVAVPSQAHRDFLQKHGHLLPGGIPVVTVAKGIENETLLTMTEVLEHFLPESSHPNVAVLSGPSFAREMVQKLPTVVTVASRWEKTARKVQAMFQSDTFRTYTSTDVVGVQVGGALKNVIAIAAGMSDGLGMGHNTRTAIITRGLAEISRVAIKMGGNALTLAGLAGMGDLVLTCTGDLSRNRQVGIELGRGRSLDDILKGMSQVAEGVKTARSAKDLSVKLGVELPICETVYAIAYQGKNPRAAAMDLMLRAPKSESM